MMIKTFRQEAVTPLLRPQSGIDKIKVLPPQHLVNIQRFEAAVKTSNPYTLLPGNNQICIEKAGGYYLVIINQEFFNFLCPMLAQIGAALFILMKHNFLLFTEEAYWNPLVFIRHITEAEFYFDHRRYNCCVFPERAAFSIDEAKASEMLYRYSRNGVPSNTYYSWDSDSHAGRKSTLTVYDKEQADLTSIWRGNGISVAEQRQRIFLHPYKVRLEYRLNRNNCAFLHPYNFQGNYKTVLGRYKEFLAVMHNRYFSKNIFYKERTNNDYDRVVRCAKNANQLRFTNSNGRLLNG